MRNVKLILGFLVILSAGIAIFFALNSEKALLTHPKGTIARSIIHLIATNYLLMLIVILPTLIFLFLVIWKYRAKNKNINYEPDLSYGPFGEVILWIIPASVIAVMAVINWKTTHELDPYKPLTKTGEFLTIQVVALDWKWLFIYPTLGIATVNFVQFPEKMPIHFKLAADGSPMNSFWIPQLSGQIYAMTGMTTSLHIMADGKGEYVGRAAEINGKGFADMTFVVKSSSQSEFENWVSSVKNSSFQLNQSAYETLSKSKEKHPITLYSSVENDLFNKIIMKYMHHDL